MAECRAGRGMRTPHRPHCWLLLLLATVTATMGEDTNPAPGNVQKPQSLPAPSDTAAAAAPGHSNPAPLYDLHLDTPANFRQGSPQPGQLGFPRSPVYPPGLKDTTTGLPKFLPDGPRPFVPDPSILPGDSDIRVLEGDQAILPCTVQYLGTRQISWQKVGREHLLSIGTEVWVKDQNLEVEHHLWPAEVGDWNLVFREARLEDSGLYECQVISTDKLTRRVRLSVVENNHRPVIHIEGKQFVEHGQTVYLRCNTTEGGRMPEHIDWFKDGDKIDGSQYPKVFITKHKSEKTKSLVSELMIASGTSEDTGTYICRSSSQLIASIEVNVLIADSPNVKRGTGTSHTQVGTQQNDENAAMFLPSFLANPLILFLTLVSTLVAQQLAT